MSEEFSQYSYVRRRGRTTGAQAKALEQDLDQFAIELDDAAAFTSGTGAHGVEIGFGMGDSLMQWAETSPDVDLLGIDLYLPGVGSLVNKLGNRNITNVQIVVAPAQEVFLRIPEQCLDEVRILFPDPWPKKRHAKRRLIQKEFIADVARTLKPGGLLRIATDWDPYGESIREVLSSEGLLENVVDETRDSMEPSVRNTATKFEQRGRRLGHRIHDLVYQRRNSATTESR